LISPNLCDHFIAMTKYPKLFERLMDDYSMTRNPTEYDSNIILGTDMHDG
jgi:hypothetical protein